MTEIDSSQFVKLRDKLVSVILDIIFRKLNMRAPIIAFNLPCYLKIKYDM